MFIVIASIHLMSCSRSSNTLVVSTDTGFDKHTVYMAGYTIDTITKLHNAAYWVNGVIVPLVNNGNMNLEATGIVVDGTDVYVTGYNYLIGYRNSLSVIPVFWKNGVPYNFPENPTAQRVGLANNLFISNKDVFIAGEYKGNASIWKNGVRTTLDTSTSYSSIANAVFVQGSDIYVVGSVSKFSALLGGYGPIAILWKNSVPNQLGKGYSEAYSVFVKGNDVYVGGFDDPENNVPYLPKHYACYWKNGVYTNLDNIKRNYSRVNALCFDGKDLLAVGETMFWKNNQILSLNAENTSSYTSVVQIDGESFIGGQSFSAKSSVNSVVTLWHNEHLFQFPFYGSTNAIFVK